MNQNVGPKLYTKSLELNMIEQFKDLRVRVKTRKPEISGSFNGILRALGAEMDRKSGINDEFGKNTGPITYEEAENIDNLLENIKFICSEVKNDKHYYGMLRELSDEIISKHGKYGDK